MVSVGVARSQCSAFVPREDNPMATNDLIIKGFASLDSQARALFPSSTTSGVNVYSPEPWSAWVTSAMNLLDRAFGRDSVHFVNLKKAYDNYRGAASDVDSAKGIFSAAKADYEGGYTFRLEARISGEIFADLVVLAKEALANDNDKAAAVLACAALEDALKRFALMNGIDVAEKEMQDIVNALKAAGLVTGARKSLLDVMPKIRNYAMHANWEKITRPDISSVIGFVEEFLLAYF
jgi:Domain of unknown function (DUF4145)